MQDTANVQHTAQGIVVQAAPSSLQRCLDSKAAANLERWLDITEEGGATRFTLNARALHELTPDFDTLRLHARLDQLAAGSDTDLDREILLAMLASPVTLAFPSCAELVASIGVRRNIVEAARRTALSFHTSKIERPEEYWTYHEDTGFTLLPGKPLIEALRMATQPGVSGRQYAFSCYRATEYVMLLGIAQELASRNPALLQQLQRHCEARAIMSGQFHDTFLREYGSTDAPLPPRYYVPGDRVWFRNPDERSSDVEGYEGSWVLYLGGGQFTNFWECGKSYGLTEKCIEIYHWRSGARPDAAGDLRMDETIVAARVQETLRDPAEVSRILERMMRMRDPSGVYADGGCIDRTREHPRWVCPGTSDIALPALAAD